MKQIEAICRHGVFEPIDSVDLPEGQRVTLAIELIDKETPEQWLERVQARHAGILEKNGGPLPDSTQMIAEDRLR